MASRPSGRRKKTQKPPPARGARNKQPPGDRDATTVRARRRPGEAVWELVHPRCARQRQDDLEEVRKMLEAGETDVARDECRWLLEGCSDLIEAHRLLGEIALAEGDLPLARGHFGYAFRLGAGALAKAGTTGPLPYRLPANQAFLAAAGALAGCLKQLGKAEMAAEVVEQLLACDPDDPLEIGKLPPETA